MCFQSLSHPPPLREKHLLKPSQLSVSRRTSPHAPPLLETARRGPTSSATPGPGAGLTAPATQGPLLASDAGNAASHWPDMHKRPPPGSCKAASLLTPGGGLRDGPRGRARKWTPVRSQPATSGGGEPSDSEARPEDRIRQVASPFVHSGQRRGGPRRLPPRKRK